MARRRTLFRFSLDQIFSAAFARDRRIASFNCLHKIQLALLSSLLKSELLTLPPQNASELCLHDYESNSLRRRTHYGPTRYSLRQWAPLRHTLVAKK
jgi:hypothetical protein